MYGLKEWLLLVIIGIFVALVVGRLVAIAIVARVGKIKLFSNIVISFILSLLLPTIGFYVFTKFGSVFFQRHLIAIVVCTSFLLGIPHHIYHVQLKKR